MISNCYYRLRILVDDFADLFLVFEITSANPKLAKTIHSPTYIIWWQLVQQFSESVLAKQEFQFLRVARKHQRRTIGPRTHRERAQILARDIFAIENRVAAAELRARRLLCVERAQQFVSDVPCQIKRYARPVAATRMRTAVCARRDAIQHGRL